MVITVVPRPTPVKAIKLENKDKLVNLHSNLFKYDEIDFVCDHGHPMVGGYIVPVLGTRKYFAEAKFNLLYVIQG